MFPGKHKTGLLLIGHGTRDAQGMAEFLATAALVQNLVQKLVPDVLVEAGFLELARPTIAEALERLAAGGAGEVVAVPLLLFAAGHAKQDIPAAVTAAADHHPTLSIRQAQPLACHEKVLELSSRRFQEALAANDMAAAGDVRLILVGRGSSDADATADMLRFTRLRADRDAVRQTATAFMAVARPSLSEALQTASVSAPPIVIVQPHLLFHGHVLRQLNTAVSEARTSAPDKQWLVAEHLGVDRLVAAAAIERFSTALAADPT